MERSVDPEHLSRSLPPDIPVTVVNDPVKAISTLVGKSRANEVIVVTGSLYLLGQVRPFLLQMREAQGLGAQA